jgi:hypothetical protein
VIGSLSTSFWRLRSVRSRIIRINESTARTAVNSNPFRLADNYNCTDSAPTLGVTNFAPESS